jgi:hypothetical protein
MTFGLICIAAAIALVGNPRPFMGLLLTACILIASYVVFIKPADDKFIERDKRSA